MKSPQAVTLLLACGLVFGSFINALVWRLKKNKNWVTGRSACTHCGHKLSALDLVPVFSYLFLKGRCKYCHKKIEDSPLIELGTGISFALSYLFWPYSFEGVGMFQFIIWLVALIILIALFVYDLRWMILPDKLTRALLAVAIIQAVTLVFLGNLEISNLAPVALSVIVGGGIFHLIYEYSKGKYIGGGDAKLGYAYGLLLLDPLHSWMVLTIASLLGSLVALWLIVMRKKSLGTKLPFGPLLILGVFVSVLFGQEIWAYLNTLMLQ